MSIKTKCIVWGKSCNKPCISKHFLYSILYLSIVCANEVLFFPLADRLLSFGSVYNTPINVKPKGGVVGHGVGILTNLFLKNSNSPPLGQNNWSQSPPSSKWSWSNVLHTIKITTLGTSRTIKIPTLGKDLMIKLLWLAWPPSLRLNIDRCISRGWFFGVISKT